MIRVTLAGRPRLAVAILVGIVGCVAATIKTWNTRLGDPRRAIEETEAGIARLAFLMDPSSMPKTGAHSYEVSFHVFQRDNAWGEFDAKCASLSPRNRSTASARGVLALGSA